MVGPPPDDWEVVPGAAGARQVAPGLWRLRLPMAWPAIDHVNAYDMGLAALVLERRGAELWAHPDDDHFDDTMRDPERIVAARERRARREGVPDARLEVFSTAREELEGVLAPVRADHPLVAGAAVPSALGPWEVVETPGHCPSHVCLVQRERASCRSSPRAR